MNGRVIISNRSEYRRRHQVPNDFSTLYPSTLFESIAVKAMDAQHSFKILDPHEFVRILHLVAFCDEVSISN